VQLPDPREASVDVARPAYRWVVLAASVVVVMCTGVIYAFSVFAGPLGEAHGWSGAQVMLAFALNGAVAPVPMLLGGIALDRGWARQLMMTGAVLFGLGFAMTGTATTPVGLSLWYGVVTAFGVGFCYSTAVSNTIRYFPDRRGFAAGVITAGVGASSVIGAPVASAVIGSAGVSAAFVRMGLVYGVVALVAASFIRSAPTARAARAGADAATGDGATGDAAVGHGAVADGVPWYRMVRSTRFFVIFALFAMSLFAPVMALSQLSGIGQSSRFGLSAGTAALFVAAFALAKAVGGPAWGVVADRRGGPVTVTMLGAVSAVSLVVLLTVHSPVGFAIGVLGLGSTLGGVFGVFPALTMTTFGPRFQGTNYAIMFVAYAVAAFVGPRFAATQSVGGDYGVPFVVALVVSLGAVALAPALRSRRAPRHDPVAPEPARGSAPEQEPAPERVVVGAGR